MPEQLTFWKDIRIPPEFLTHFKETGECLNCGQGLRHPLHAFNHWRRYHVEEIKLSRRTSGQRRFIWLNGAWVEVGLIAFLEAIKHKIPIAFTKAPSDLKGQRKGENWRKQGI